MTTYNRRRFLQISAVAVSAHGLWSGSAVARSGKPLRLGLFVGARKDPESAIAKVHDLGLPTCQVGVDELAPELAPRLKSAMDRYGIEVTALSSAGPGPHVWDFYQGPSTIGLVPRQFRRQRIDQLKRVSDLAKQLGIPALHTHCGFIPEDPNDKVYREVVEATREVATHCKGNGQQLLYETGQETPITLLRTIEDVGLDNQRVNLDTANLILYGKGNPVDALDVIGKLVGGIHAKDGLFPTDPKRLGEEVPIGQGKVDFPTVIRRLKELGYQGAITIEREISGPRQIEDVRKEKAYLERLIG